MVAVEETAALLEEWARVVAELGLLRWLAASFSRSLLGWGAVE